MGKNQLVKIYQRELLFNYNIAIVFRNRIVILQNKL